jgi:ADP-heptose:LPS heptosyltransferase
MPLPEVALWPEELRNSKILVCHQGAVGDLILALPAIKALRDALLPARLEMLGHPWTLALVHGRPYADAVIDINRGDMAPLFQQHAPLPRTITAYLGTFAAAFCFSRSETLAHNFRRAGIRHVYTLPSFPETRTHVTDHHLLSLKSLGISPTSAVPLIRVREEEQREARKFLRSQGWDPARIVALHPGAGSRKKAWPAARFAALARTLANQSHTLLIIQGPADEGAVQETVKELADIPYLLVQDLSLTRLAALLSFASLFIGNDSGISHLAAALNIPTIALFGPTDPYVWAPRGNRALWLQGQAACAPCTREDQQRCERQHCLDGIEAAQVMALIAEKGLTGAEGGSLASGPLAINNRAAFHDRKDIPQETPARQYEKEGIAPSPP